MLITTSGTAVLYFDIFGKASVQLCGISFTKRSKNGFALHVVHFLEVYIFLKHYSTLEKPTRLSYCWIEVNTRSFARKCTTSAIITQFEMNRVIFEMPLFSLVMEVLTLGLSILSNASISKCHIASWWAARSHKGLGTCCSYVDNCCAVEFGPPSPAPTPFPTSRDPLGILGLCLQSVHFQALNSVKVVSFRRA